MRLIVATLLALHGVAHFVGVRGAFWPAGARQRRLVDVPPAVEGIAWLVVGLAFLTAAAMVLSAQEAAPTLVLVASAASLLLCVQAWPEAKIGVFVDAFLLAVTLLFAPTSTHGHLVSAFDREVQRSAGEGRRLPFERVDEAALEGLPSPVQRYLRFMGVPGRPRQSSVRSSFTGYFRRDEGPWLPCEAMQLDAREPVTRVYVMQLSLFSLLPVTVRDEYVAGRGTLNARAFDLFTVASGSGHEIDVGELVTYLNDAILLAPSLLLDARTAWRGVDANTFDVSIADRSLEVTARVSLNAEGAPLSFSTTDRYFEAQKGQWLRTEWVTPVDGWQSVNGRKLPTSARAVWQLSSGPFTYAKFTFDPRRIVLTPP